MVNLHVEPERRYQSHSHLYIYIMKMIYEVVCMQSQRVPLLVEGVYLSKRHSPAIVMLSEAWAILML